MSGTETKEALEEIRRERIAAITALREAGIDTYPERTARTHTILELREAFATLETSGERVAIAGRVMALREHGGTVFADIFDGTATVQGYFKADTMRERFDALTQLVSRGDFITVTGSAFTTKRGEPSVHATDFSLLTKSILPIPTEHFGLKDEDERFRKRYLDILLNEEVRARVSRRSRFWNAARTFLLARGFVEVETPVLETTPGGADAQPFITHHNALDMDVYLRISAGELWQKKLLVAGIPKTFEIGRIFRNEGMSSEHLQDYTQLEFYEAYSDMHVGMQLVRDLYVHLAEETFGTTRFSIRGHELDLSAPWTTYHFSDLIQETYGIDPRDVSEEKALNVLATSGISYDTDKRLNKERAIDLLWKKIRTSLAGPGYLVGVPVYLEPLAKKSSEDPRVVERFQVILAGSEVGKGFSELNDPIDQRERFEHQEALRLAGDAEAQFADKEYVEALEYGMPPAFGFGVSERLYSFLEGISVREGQLFPLMRRRASQG